MPSMGYMFIQVGKITVTQDGKRQVFKGETEEYDMKDGQWVKRPGPTIPRKQA